MKKKKSRKRQVRERERERERAIKNHSDFWTCFARILVSKKKKCALFNVEYFEN